jgi:hypothetical protein
MKVVLIQIVLIAVVVLMAVRLFRYRDARAQALRRLGLVVFALFAVVSILVPDVWNAMARALGVGRGTDMVLYALVVAFLSFTVTTYVRFRELELRFTQIARRLALDEARGMIRPDVLPGEPRPAPRSGGDGGDVLDEPGRGD